MTKNEYKAIHLISHQSNNWCTLNMNQKTLLRFANNKMCPK